MQQATPELLHFLLFLSTPSSHPPSLCWKKSSSWFFSLKRAEANWILAAFPFSGLWLQTRREEGGQDRGREGRAKKERKKKRGKVLCGTFLKPALTTAPTDNGTKYVHLIEKSTQAEGKKGFKGIGEEKKAGDDRAEGRGRQRHRLRR